MLSILALSLPSTEALSFGGSKLFQILTPLLAYMILQEVPGLQDVFPNFVRRLNPKADVDRWNSIFRMLIGFISWKIGCDFGFLIVNTGAAPWSIAFTIAGLIPYGIGMYIVYYLFGQKILIQGQLNPFKEEYNPPRISGKPLPLKQFTSKFFHESMNATSANVPLRQVFVKPLIDYGAILITWPLYNIALLFSQSGEINFAPMIHFTFLSILVFYIVNVSGFILGFNLGEFIYFRIHDWVESIKIKSRQFNYLNKIKRLWDTFDLNGDGSISPEELQQVIRTLGQDPTNADFCLLLREADIDCSGSIEFTEFKQLLISRQSDRRIQLLTKNKSIDNPNWFLRSLSTLALQAQVIKNNTTYIRIQGFLRRYGLNNRWLLSGGLGLLFIVLLEPSISSTIFGWSDRLKHLWFYQFGHLDESHLAQVMPLKQAYPFPDPADLNTQFSQQLVAFYSPESTESILISDARLP